MLEASRLSFLSENQHYTYHQELQNGVEVMVDITFVEEKFLSFQEGLIEEYVGDMIDNLTYDDLTLDQARNIMQTMLESLNDKLFHFAQRIQDVEFFPLKWSISVFHNKTLMTSMIGDVSLFVVREWKILYAVANETVSDKGVDVFSDFIEWDMQDDDYLMMMWVSHENILSKRDKKDIEHCFAHQPWDAVTYVGELLSSKTHPHDIGFVISYCVGDGGLVSTITSMDEKRFLSFFQKNKYYVVIGLIFFVTLFLLYSLIQNAYNTQQVASYIDENGESVDVSPSSIERNIEAFRWLDSASKDKAVLYKQIMQDIAFLESQGEWPQSVQDLKITINNLYLKGFSIETIGDKDLLSDIQTFRYMYPFNSEEKELLWTPQDVYFNDALYVWGTNGALLEAISETQRAVPVSFSQEIAGCHPDLTRVGLYCFGGNDIIRVTKAWTEPVGHEWGDFVGPIVDLWLFNNNNLYVLSNNPALTTENVYVTRYRNSPGSYIDFAGALLYQSDFSGKNLTDMHIDNGTFLMREPTSKTLYQLWREWVSTELTKREVYMLWSQFDIIKETLSDDIEILTEDDSKYVYLYDQKQQQFVVFATQPLKNQNIKSFNLSYMFALSFELSNDVIDAYVVEQPGNIYLYIMTSQGVYQVKLSDFISQYGG